jgi:Major tropism determinant N-terminal domain
MAVQIQTRNGTAAQWTSANPTLMVGEIGAETDTGRFKIGNGSTAWNSLTYAASAKWQGAYSAGTAYVVNDVVSYNNSSYICILNSTGNLPTNATYWSLLALAGTNGTNGTNGTSFIWQGAYNGATAYAANDVVSYNNSTYICILASTGNLPTNATYWSLMALAGAGDVVGPASSTDSVLAVYDGTTGKLLKNSTMPISSVGYIGSPQVSGGATAYTLALADAGDHVYFTGGSTATLTVPTNATVAFPTGTTILVLNNNSGNLTISGAGVTFQLANGSTGNRTVATKGMASLIKVATDTWWVTGPGVT